MNYTVTDLPAVMLRQAGQQCTLKELFSLSPQGAGNKIQRSRIASLSGSVRPNDFNALIAFKIIISLI